MTNTVFFPGLGLEFELNRVAIQDFPIPGHNIYWYGVIIAAGFLLAVIYGLWRSPRFSMDPDVIVDAIFVVVPSAILGARLYYVIFEPSVCFDENGSFSLLRAVAFWDGGLAIYGGVIATVIAAIIIGKVRRENFWSGMDITVYGLLIGQAVGRWGNFVNVECYGGLTTLPWRMCSVSIANDLWRNGLLESEAAYQSVLDGTLGVHPAFFYESMWNLLGFLLLVLLAKVGRKFNGQMFLSYIIWYGLGRATIEGLRTDSLYFFGTGIRTSQMVGVLSVVVGAALFLFRLKTAGPADPPLVKENGKWVRPQLAGGVPAEESEPAAEAENVPEEESGPAAEAEDVPEEEIEPAAKAEAAPEEESGPVAAAAVEAAPEEDAEEEKRDGGDNS